MMAPAMSTIATLAVATLESEWYFSTTFASRWKYCAAAPALASADSNEMPAIDQAIQVLQRPQKPPCSRITRVGGGDGICSICMMELRRVAVERGNASLPFFRASRYP